MAFYICFEGTDGVGKTTQIELLSNYLKSQNFKVLQTKEPGTPLVPSTMRLRSLMLDLSYEKNPESLLIELESLKSEKFNDFALNLINQAISEISINKSLTILSREYIAQTIRSIHLNELILPAIDHYDFIIQDRGVFSGLSYGVNCGFNRADLEVLIDKNISNSFIKGKSLNSLYDMVIYLDGDPEISLKKAKSAKKEYALGDAMEEKGNEFIKKVGLTFRELLKNKKNTSYISVYSHKKFKDKNQIFNEILNEVRKIKKDI